MNDRELDDILGSLRDDDASFESVAPRVLAAVRRKPAVAPWMWALATAALLFLTFAVRSAWRVESLPVAVKPPAISGQARERAVEGGGDGLSRLRKTRGALRNQTAELLKLRTTCGAKAPRHAEACATPTNAPGSPMLWALQKPMGERHPHKADRAPLKQRRHAEACATSGAGCAESITVKLYTPDPEVVIYWIVEGE